MAVTVVRQPEVHDGMGRLTAVNARLTIGANLDTWTPALRSIVQVIVPPFTNLTSVAVDTASPPNVVFTTGGVVTNLDITVLGYK
jgi:hypothetical protein